MTKRRAIRRDEEASIRARVAKAIGVDPWQVNTGAYPDRIRLIEVRLEEGGALRGLYAPEIVALAAVGIHPGADGWEIEEAPAAVKVGDRFRSKKSGETWTVERWLTTDALWAIRCADGGTLYMTESDLLDPAQWTREAPANARPTLPPAFGWYQRGVDSYSLDGPDGRPIARVRCFDPREGWGWKLGDAKGEGTIWTDAHGKEDGKRRAEEACRAAGLFGAPTVDRAQAIRDALIERLTCSPLPSMSNILNLLNGSEGRLFATSDEIKAALVSIGAEPDGNRWRLSDGPPPGWEWADDGLMYLAPTGVHNQVAESIAAVDESDWEVTDRCLGSAAHATGTHVLRIDGQAAALMACRMLGLFAAAGQAPTAPDLGAKVDALHDAAGAPPTGAARALLRLVLRLIGRAEGGEYLSAPKTFPDELAPLTRLCGAFVAELRASLPAPPMPAPRTTDGALTAYMLEHYRDAWRPGEDALALAIRLLGEASDTIADTREEARVADESARELEAELRQVRADLAKETERRVEANGWGDEAG